MDLLSVKEAYRRHAPYYDIVFGTLLTRGRGLAVEMVNRLRGPRLLELGVGTGLSLRQYRSDRQIVGIDISPEMLKRARRRVASARLRNVLALLEMDAEELAFADNSFDIVAAMYVVSVVPDPVRLLREVQRVCVPGGDILIVNHFAQARGLRGEIERRLAPLSRHLGWRPDFALQPFLASGSVELVEWRNADPFGLVTLLHCRNTK
jgi:phosphatidylethanolamine/phosphatidyl-N-methylethanolamine N-methyltransferase